MNTNTTARPKLAFSIKEACAASSLGRTTIYNHIAAGRLRAVRIGGRTIIPADALHALERFPTLLNRLRIPIVKVF